MKKFIVPILAIAAFSLQASAKPMTEQQSKCMAELATYKNKNGKQELTGKKLTNTCAKNSGDKFLSCVSQTNRTFGSMESTVNFCSKKPSPKQESCVVALGNYKKNGKQEIKGKTLTKACMKNSSDKFLSCVASTQRTLASADTAAQFCSAKPSKQEEKCVQEIGSYKLASGKQALSGKDLMKVCHKNASDKFLSCVASNQSSLNGIKAGISTCGKSSVGGGSNRMPASVKKKKVR